MKKDDPLKGLHRGKKKLADGTIKKYYGLRIYNGKGGSKSIKAEYGTPEFLIELGELRKEFLSKREENLEWLFNEYFKSSKFLELADATKKVYKFYAQVIIKKYPNFELKLWQTKNAKRSLNKWKEEMYSTKRKANYILNILKAVFTWAVKNDYMQRNIVKDIDLYKVNSRAEIVWTEQDFEKLMNVAPLNIKIAAMIAIETGQRQGDILKLKYSDLKMWQGKEYFEITQHKTGSGAIAPITKRLKEFLEKHSLAYQNKNGYFVTTLQGKPFQSGFTSFFLKIKNSADLGHVTFHDLKGSFVRYLSEIVGCHKDEITAISGNDSGKKNSSLMNYMVWIQTCRPLAFSAIEKLENYRTVNQTVNREICV